MGGKNAPIIFVSPPRATTHSTVYVLKNSQTSSIEESDEEIDRDELIRKQEKAENDVARPNIPVSKPEAFREIPKEVRPRTTRRRSAQREKKKSRSRNRRNSDAHSLQQGREGNRRAPKLEAKSARKSIGEMELVAENMKREETHPHVTTAELKVAA